MEDIKLQERLFHFYQYLESKNLKFKQDISKLKNMSFNETDTYTCANNQKLEFKYTSK